MSFSGASRKGLAPLHERRVELKRNDIVTVISGRDKGKSGRVLSIDTKSAKALVEHVMMIKRHTRPNPAKQIKGGIAERESPIAISNLMIVCSACGPVRIAHRLEPAGGGKFRRVRTCRKCGAPLDRKA
jgi:large subunit ribosomal protein L24